ncbi:MAG: SRPBCC family protein [Gemmatimonadota bacterium]
MIYASAPVEPARRKPTEWTLEASAEAPATADTVWLLWSDVTGWSAWDPDVEWCSLDSPLAAGARGTLKTRTGPVMEFQVTEAVRGRGFTERARLPFTTLEIMHRVDRLPHGFVRITHRVRMRGLLVPLYRRTLGRRFEADLPGGVRRLALLAAQRDAARARL